MMCAAGEDEGLHPEICEVRRRMRLHAKGVPVRTPLWEILRDCDEDFAYDAAVKRGVDDDYGRRLKDCYGRRPDAFFIRRARKRVDLRKMRSASAAADRTRVGVEDSGDGSGGETGGSRRCGIGQLALVRAEFCDRRGDASEELAAWSRRMMRRIVEILHDGDGPASVDAAADEAKVCGAEGRELPGEGVEGGGSCAQSFYPAPTSPAPTLTPARARLPTGFVSPPPVLPAPPDVSPAARPRAETSPPPRPSAPPPAPSPAVEKALPVGSRPSYAFLWSTPLDVDGLASHDEEGAWMDAMDAFDVAAGRGPAPSGGASFPCALGRAPTPALSTPPCLSPRPPAGRELGFQRGVDPWNLAARLRRDRGPPRVLWGRCRDRDRAGMAAEDTALRDREQRACGGGAVAGAHWMKPYDEEFPGIDPGLRL